MPRPLRIALITTWATNVGDDFIREGIRAVLDGICDYQACLVNKHEPELTCRTPLPGDEAPPMTDKILTADAVIQCGTPVYWNLGPAAGQKCSTAEWIQPLWYDRIGAIHDRRPVLNIAAGACQRYYGTPDDILCDPDCTRFIKDAHRFCRLVTVRDGLAEEVHRRLGLAVHRLPCSAVHAWRRHPAEGERRFVALNLMQLGGHWDLDGRSDPAAWKACCDVICRGLAGAGENLLLIAHDRDEANFMRDVAPGHPVFCSADYREYFAAYAQCRGGIFNRVHGAMILAAQGVPAVVVGNDSRTWMVDEVGLPRRPVANADPTEIVELLLSLMGRDEVTERLIDTEHRAYHELRALVANTLSINGLPMRP